MEASSNFIVFWQFLVLIFVVAHHFQGFIIHNVEATGWLDAHATFYGINQDPSSLGGACGYENTNEAGFGVYTTALSGALFRGGAACGACYQLICNSRLDRRWCIPRASVTVTATNFCPANHRGGWCDPPRHHFDMSMPAFLRIGRQAGAGVVPVLFRRVSCKRRGGVRFTLRGRSNFNMVRISNVGGSGDVKGVWIRGSKSRTWLTMHRNWGANWQSTVDVRRQVLSFRIMLGDGKTLIFFNVVPSSWQFGQTFAARNQFS